LVMEADGPHGTEVQKGNQENRPGGVIYWEIKEVPAGSAKSTKKINRGATPPAKKKTRKNTAAEEGVSY